MNNLERKNLIRELRILKGSLNEENRYNKQRERIRNFYKLLRKTQYVLPYLISTGITITGLYTMLGSPVDESILYDYNNDKKYGKPDMVYEIQSYKSIDNEITFYGPWTKVEGKYVQEAKKFVLKELSLEQINKLFIDKVIAVEAIVGEYIYGMTTTTDVKKSGDDFNTYYTLSLYDEDSGYTCIIKEKIKDGKLPIELIYILAILSSSLLGYLVSKKMFLPFEYYEKQINQRYPDIDTSFLRSKIKKLEGDLSRCRK